MRLLCPYPICQKAITVPDSEAGKAVHCPECGQEFTAPQLYTPPPQPGPSDTTRVPRPSPVPAPVPETYVSGKTEAGLSDLELPDLPPPDREMSGYARMASVTLEPRVIRWIPAGALFLAFILTMLPWSGIYLAGYPAFTQSPWQAVVASMSSDPVANEELKFGDARVGDILDKKLHVNFWLIPYLLLIFPTLLLAAAGPVVDVAKLKVPPNLEPYWQYRPVVLGGLVVFIFLLLLAQWASGFGLQRAVNDWIDSQFAETRAAATTPEKLQVWEMKVGLRKNEYQAKTTTWLRLAILMHLLATAAVVTEAGLMLRGKKPLPRLAAMW